MRNMHNYISAFWGRLARCCLCELVELFGDKISWPEPNPHQRDRVFNQWRTFWLFLGQVLSATQSCREALKKAQGWLSLSGKGKGKGKGKNKKEISTSTSAYCQARWRLEQDYLDKVNNEICRETQAQIEPRHLWFGRHVKIADGSSLSMPDTKENQQCYPQPKGQKEGCGFPVMRWVAMFSLATGILLESRKGSLQVHERTLWHEMWGCYEEGDVVLADRGFCSLADFWMLSERKVDCVMRLHQARKKDAGIIKTLGKNDYLVRWEKSRQAPNWLTEQQWKDIPEEITVRQITLSIDNPGFRTRSITIATTLLDNKQFPPEALADLYRRRWLAELFIRDIKTTMRMDILRGRTPQIVHKELAIFSIAYNVIRSLIWQAAAEKGIDPYRISFSGALTTIRQWTPLLPFIQSEEERTIFMQALLDSVANDIIPIRSRKRQPRALKRRPKNFQLLTKPRDQFMEIPHRHKYQKDA